MAAIGEDHDIRLSEQLEALLSRGSAPLSELDLDAHALEQLGFAVTAECAKVPAGIERLDSSRIRDGLSQRARHWLEDLEVLPVVGSTNALLMAVAPARPLRGMVRLAEIQIQGRGRRGRGWVSPLGGSIAISVGLSLPQPAAALGGFSLCMGLAVTDLLLELGVADVEIKWPNDVIVGGRKIAGILVELQARGAGSDVVVGLGLNVRLPHSVKAGIDQPITDLESTGLQVSRNAIAAALISGVVDYSEGFAQCGFAPMQRVFDQHHRFHGKPCRLLFGDRELSGVVRGVTETGELMLDTATGTEIFGAGEVSLRDATA